MATKIEIINMALISLRSNAIELPLEDTENGIKMDAIYDIVLKSMLREHPWSFAKKEVALALVSGVPGTPILEDYTYIFALPTYPDFLKLLKTSVEPDYSHKIKGIYLYSNASAVSIEYVYFNDDPTTYDAEFTDAFAARLAAELCFSITADKDLVKVKWQEYIGKMRMAKSSNGQEVTPDSPQNDEWLNSRL